MSGNEVSAVHRALNNLFTTLSPEQVQKFLSEMNGESNAPSGVAAVAASNASIMSTTPNNLLIVNKSVTSTAMETPVVTRRTSRGKRVRENGKLRPLNSFIAFRSEFICFCIIRLNVKLTGSAQASIPQLFLTSHRK